MRRSRTTRTLLTVLALVLALVWAFPVYWMLNSAFLSNVVLQSTSPTFLPFGGSLDNLRTVATDPAFAQALTISLVVTLTTVVSVTAREIVRAEPNEGSVATARRLANEPPNGRNVGVVDWSTTLGRKAELSIQ